MNLLRWHAVAATVLVLIGSLRIIATHRVFSHTIDEPDNLAAGMEYIGTGRYLYHDENPPLARVFAAIGPFLAGERYHPGPQAYLEGVRILGVGDHYDRVLALARSGILPFFWLASLVVFLWGLRSGGPIAALGATACFTTLPPVLALAGIANTDMALCATVPAAALASLSWAGRPTRRRTLALGVWIALACISKFTAIPFLAAAWAGMTLCYLRATRRTAGWLVCEAWNRRRSIALVLATAAFAIWAAYGFSFARVGWLHARLPAPRFFTGLEKVWLHQHTGHPSYLLGKRSMEGFRYYFPAVLAIKTPLGFWGLVIVSGWLVFCRKQRLEAALALAFSAAILLVSIAGNVNIGVRYVLPVFAGLSVVAGCALAGAPTYSARIAVALLLAWQVASGALQHPDYLAYTNELAGSHPERFVADSDLDWGQDMKRLAAFLQSQGARQVAFTPFNDTYPMPVVMTPSRAEAPSTGWNAVSITMWKVFGVAPWAGRMPEPKRIGRGILVWHVETGERL
jgi:hypothetical protein